MNLASVDHALTTTRSVRRRLDFARPVERRLIEESLAIAVQAPTGSNSQSWHFVVVTDAAKREAIAGLYRRHFEAYANRPPEEQPQYPADDPRAAQQARVRRSAIYLAENMHRCPVFIIPCIDGRPEGFPAAAQAGYWGSILPAAWSLMVALRARGLGTAWTTIHLASEREAAAILGVPANVTQAALLPVAHFQGSDFKPAQRLPLERVVHWEAW